MNERKSEVCIVVLTWNFKAIPEEKTEMQDKLRKEIEKSC